MDIYTKGRIRGMIGKVGNVFSAAVLASAIFGAGMYAGAALYHGYRNPGRVYEPWDVPNGDLNEDGVYPDIIINSDGRLIPMYRLDWFVEQGKIIYGNADEVMHNDICYNGPEKGCKFSKEDYATLEKKLNEDYRRKNDFDKSFLGNIIRHWLYSSD